MARMLSFVLCTCLSLLATAQDGATDRTVLLQRSALMRDRMLADSVPMTTAQVDTLQAMAARSAGSRAIHFLQQALVISDSLQDLARECDVLRALSAAYERSGHAGDALLATRAAHYLCDSLSSVAHAKELEELRAEQETERQQWEVTRAMQETELQAQRDELVQLRHRQQQTYGVAGALVVILLIVMGLVLFRAGRRKRRRNGQVVASEAIEQRSPPRRNALRPTEASVAADPVKAAPATEVDREVDADDEVLLALFHKRMPERLQALKEARARGDHEKVLRVLISIRPQLIHHDAERFTERCKQLIAAGTSVLEEASRSDLDGLIADVERGVDGPSSGK